MIFQETYTTAAYASKGCLIVPPETYASNLCPGAELQEDAIGDCAHAQQHRVTQAQKPKLADTAPPSFVERSKRNWRSQQIREEPTKGTMAINAHSERMAPHWSKRLVDYREARQNTVLTARTLHTLKTIKARALQKQRRSKTQRFTAGHALRKQAR